MDPVSPSMIYAISNYLGILPTNSIRLSETVSPSSPLLFGIARDELIRVALSCGWIHLQGAEYIVVSSLGNEIKSVSGPGQTRKILESMIERFNPAWGKMIVNGRSECKESLPSRVRQCFEESGLFDSPAPDPVKDWWSRLNRIVRYQREAKSYEVGSQGEELSIKYERARTGCDPEHISIETSWAGFDLLSVCESGSSSRLRIEVKASTLNKSNAQFYVTENEWRVANSGGEHLFHVWLLSEADRPRLARVGPSEVEPHISRNAGKGRWSSVKIPFSLFSFENASF